MWVQALGQEDSLEEVMATHSSILAWRIPWTEEPDGLLSKRFSKSWTRLKWLSMQAEVLFEELFESSSLSYVVRTCQIELECNITERKSCVTDASWSLDWKLGPGVFSFCLQTDGTLLRNFTDRQVSPLTTAFSVLHKVEKCTHGVHDD